MSSGCYSLLYQAGPFDGRRTPSCRVEQGEVEAHTPIRAIAWSVGVVFPADLDADRLLPNFKNLADLKNERHGPFPVAGGSVPVCRRFRAKGEGRMGLRRVGHKRLKEHLADTLAVFRDYDRPKLVHKRAGGQSANLLPHHHPGSDGQWARATGHI